MQVPSGNVDGLDDMDAQTEEVTARPEQQDQEASMSEEGSQKIVAELPASQKHSHDHTNGIEPGGSEQDVRSEANSEASQGHQPPEQEATAGSSHSEPQVESSAEKAGSQISPMEEESVAMEQSESIAEEHSAPASDSSGKQPHSVGDGMGEPMSESSGPHSHDSMLHDSGSPGSDHSQQQTTEAEQAGQEAEGEAEASYGIPSSEEITQRYLTLLNQGKLAKKEKKPTGSFKRWTQPAPGTDAPASPDAKQRSVYEAELQRGYSSAAAIDGMQPLQAKGRPNSTRPSGRPFSHRGGSELTRHHSSPLPQVRSPSGRTSTSAHGLHTAHSFLSAPADRSSLTSASSPFKKLYTPGPGTYSPSTNRFGNSQRSSVGFGTARQRPHNVCILDHVVSPGPVYNISKEFVSTLTSPPSLRFGRQQVGSRFDPDSEQPSNCPHWNPGPGDYEVERVPKGGSTKPGVDAVKPLFGKGDKLISPETRFSATVFVSKSHAKVENMGVHSPGPAAYSPRSSTVKQQAAQYTMGGKAASYFDVFLDPLRQPSPGPVYSTAHMDYKGGRPWGGQARPTFGKADKHWEPQSNLAATTFISESHAQIANQSVHSPGPIYYPPDIRAGHVSSPLFSSGPADRFYNRFEPSRIA